MSINLSDPIFHDEDAARADLEATRWPDGVTCPHCGGTDKVKPLGGKSMGPGWYHCGDCRDKFTVRTGSVFERSHVPLHKWRLAFQLMASSKKGMSAHQMHRTLGVTYKTAWFMAHRIREAMRDGAPAPMGGNGATVEADETYFGNRENPMPSKQRKGRPYLKSGGGANKRAVVALVERGGRVRSFHVAVADKVTVNGIVADNIARETAFYTDESRLYGDAKGHFTTHATVKHSAAEYVRGDVHTNTIEGVFSIFKRGMKGIYQHCAEKHLHRYLAEYDFRYNHRIKLGFNDTDRAIAAIKGGEGKRLTYRQPRQA